MPLSKKRQTVDRQALLQLEIQELENAETLNVTLFEEKQKELQDLRNDILRGKLIRSRAKWIQEGEQPTNYFCNLENRNYISNLMNKLYAKMEIYCLHKKLFYLKL